MGVVLLEDNVLGKRLRWLREKKDFKQNVVAKKLDITPYQLSRYESGKSKPDPELIAKLADFYEVTTDYLLGMDDTPYPHGDLAAHRSDDPMSDLPEEARKEVENFMDYIRVKYGKSHRKDNA